MSKIKEALWKAYNEAEGELNDFNVGSEEYKVIAEKLYQIRNELIKLEQIEQDTNVKVSQINAENEREKKRNIIQIATFVVSTLVSIYAITKTFKFDQVATITSTLGRNILNGVIPKMFKR